MKSAILACTAFFAALAIAGAAVKIDDEVFGQSLGGWKYRSNQAAEYALSGATYRTYKPEVTPTPDGGIFISIRIDNVRGWLASDDHAILEITVDSKGIIVSAQSNIAIQGRSIASDVILGTNEAAKEAVKVERAVQIGTDLISNLTAKMLRENIVEAGRVSFPAAVHHNYNLLFQAIRIEETPVATVVSPDGTTATPEKPVKPAPTKPETPTTPAPHNSTLEIKPYGTSQPAPLSPKK